jgi:hypothetical protein
MQRGVICGLNDEGAALAPGYSFFISFFIRHACSLHAGHNFEFIPRLTLLAAGTTHTGLYVYIWYIMYPCAALWMSLKHVGKNGRSLSRIKYSFFPPPGRIGAKF